MRTPLRLAVKTALALVVTLTSFSSANTPPQHWYGLVWRINSWTLFKEDPPASAHLSSADRAALDELDTRILGRFKQRSVDGRSDPAELASLETDINAWESELPESLRNKKILFSRVQDLKVYLDADGPAPHQRHAEELRRIKVGFLRQSEPALGAAELDRWLQELSSWEALARQDLAPGLTDAQRDGWTMVFRKRQAIGENPRLQRELDDIRGAILKADGPQQQERLNAFYNRTALLGTGTAAVNAETAAEESNKTVLHDPLPGLHTTAPPAPSFLGRNNNGKITGTTFKPVPYGPLPGLHTTAPPGPSFLGWNNNGKNTGTTFGAFGAFDALVSLFHAGAADSQPTRLSPPAPLPDDKVLASIDWKRAKALGAQAACREGSEFGGKCYGGVINMMEYARLEDGSRVFCRGWQAQVSGLGSAYQLAKYITPENLRILGLAIVPQDELADVLPPGGSIIVYGRDQCKFNKIHGHVEIVTTGGRVCSDGCTELSERRLRCIRENDFTVVLVPVLPDIFLASR